MKPIAILTAALLLMLAVDTARAADTKLNWATHCLKCHGTDGRGDTKMGKKLAVKDYTDPKVQASMKDEEMLKAIKDGVKQGETVKMIAYKDKLSDDEIKALVEFVRALKK